MASIAPKPHRVIMGRPKKVNIDLVEKLKRIAAAGISGIEGQERPGAEVVDNLPTLNERIRTILQIVNDKPMKANELLYLVMYDIEDNKVRKLIADYLLGKGCVRIQKSVYFARTKPKVFTEIHETLKEVQEAYTNADSIILVPVHSKAAGSMRVIGKDIQIDTLLDQPNTLFF